MALSSIYNSTGKNYQIFTDSLSTLLALKQYYPRHQLILQIQNKIHDIISNKNHISLIWIPSHIGIEGNERVDQLAAQAHLDPRSNIAIPYYDIRVMTNDLICSKWQKEWDKITNFLKIVMPELNSSQNTKINELSRNNLNIINRLKLGHSKITHSWILNKTNPPICENCDTKLTIQHILIECQNYNEIRKKHQIPNDIRSIFKDEKLQNLLSFIKEINMFNNI
ncbi:hypothetical protein HELRODRAFT_167833 [Helobdella robusta]|uniref:RNase H type-1 domain-containing protein n=1 Tax=Helobdella robusta TaxID=6412 RepID=T1EZU8_HELRO|nr:hypothetical protein HELRODRAFT_167833 [Helobdella robusta]ESO09997.1 hypothetical protein HELRODRAFT_167833 [Helobdella robusta]